MSTYDHRAGGAHFSAAVPQTELDAHAARMVELRQKRIRDEAPVPMRCPDTGEPFCTCSAHITPEAA